MKPPKRSDLPARRSDNDKRRLHPAPDWVALEYHGYPVRPSEAITEQVIKRFAAWAQTDGTDSDRYAAENCRALYGISR